MRISLVFAAALLAFGGCGRSEAPAPAAVDTLRADSARLSGDVLAQSAIVDLIASEPRFSTFAAVMDSAGLRRTLSGAGPFTVFAPTNEALAVLPEDSLAALLLPAQRQALQNLALYHVVQGRMIGMAPAESLATSLQGDQLQIGQSGGRLRVNGVPVVGAGVRARNGMIYVIGSVLQPPPMVP